MRVTSPSPFAASAAVLTPDRFAALSALARRATARYRRAGVDSADILAAALSAAAESGPADLLSLVSPGGEADALRRLENLARAAARSNARRLARECGAVAAGNAGVAALAAIGEAVAASPRSEWAGALHRSTGDAVRDSAREAAVAADGQVRRSAAAPLAGYRGGDVTARYTHSAAAFAATDAGGTLAAQNASLRAADRSLARMAEVTHREGGATLIREASLARLMAEAMRPGGSHSGFAASAGRTLPGEAISLDILSERSTAAAFRETFAAAVDSASLVTSGKGGKVTAEAVARYSASRSLRAERASHLRAEAVRLAAHSAALAATFAREVKGGRSVTRADVSAAAHLAASAERSADLAREFAAASRVSLSRLILAAVTVDSADRPDLDLRSVAAVLSLPFDTVLRSGAVASAAAPGAVRLRAIVAAARSAAVAAAEADRTGARSPRAEAVDTVRAKVAARSARRSAPEAAVRASGRPALSASAPEAVRAEATDHGPGFFAPAVAGGAFYPGRGWTSPR